MKLKLSKQNEKDLSTLERLIPLFANEDIDNFTMLQAISVIRKETDLQGLYDHLSTNMTHTLVETAVLIIINDIIKA